MLFFKFSLTFLDWQRFSLFEIILYLISNWQGCGEFFAHNFTLLKHSTFEFGSLVNELDKNFFPQSDFLSNGSDIL